MKKMSKKEEKDFYNSFKPIKTDREEIKSGDMVRFINDSPWVGCTGEVTGFSTIMNKERAKVRIHDMNDHEVFVMDLRHVKVLS